MLIIVVCARILTATLNDIEELVELDFSAAIFIHCFHNFHDLAAVFDQSKRNQWFFEFLNSDGFCPVLSQRVETSSQ